jgi:hypothetical protein
MTGFSFLLAYQSKTLLHIGANDGNGLKVRAKDIKFLRPTT